MLILASAATNGGNIAPAPRPEAIGATIWIMLVLAPVLSALTGRLIASVLRIPAVRMACFHSRWAIASCAAVLALLVGLWAGGAAQGPIEAHGFVAFGLRFNVTPASLLFSLFACWLWFLASVFAQGYLAHSRAHARFYLYFLLCLSGTLGTFQAGNFLTLFVFFEMVSLGAYPLVVHEETAEAHSAGRLYLFISIVGGLCVFLGTALMQALRGTTELSVITGAELTEPGWLAAAALLLIGFAVKAGLVPLHIWLPRAHPVAPAPASALLSGVMIKTGAWGIYQVIRIFGAQAVEHEAESGHALLTIASNVASAAVESHGATTAAADIGALVGGILVPVALLTMALGATMALFATNVKRVLAYSSVSQIGYVVLGAAMAGVLGSSEAMGSAGFAFHALAHALFKATMFLLVGLIYQKTHDLDIRRIGPLGRQMPVTAAVFGLSVLGIIGMPGFSGYPSKTLLHDAILLMLHGAGGSGWAAAEWVFTLTSAMTTAYMGKLWYLLFVRRSPAMTDGAVASGEHSGGRTGDGHGQPAQVQETAGERLMLVLAALPLLAVGLGYRGVLARLVIPFTEAMGLGPEAAHHVESLAFFEWAALRGAVLPLSLGALLLLVLDRLRYPGPLPDGLPSIEGSVVSPLVVGLAQLTRLGAWLDGVINSGYLGLVGLASRITLGFGRADHGVDNAIRGSAVVGGRLATGLAASDLAIDQAIVAAAPLGSQATHVLEWLDAGIDRCFVAVARCGDRVVRRLLAVDSLIDRATVAAANHGDWMVRGVTALDSAVDHATEACSVVGEHAVRALTSVDAALDRGTMASASVGDRVVGALTESDSAMDRLTVGSAWAGEKAIDALHVADGRLMRGFGGLTAKVWAPLTRWADRRRRSTGQTEYPLLPLKASLLLVAALAALAALTFLTWSGLRVAP